MESYGALLRKAREEKELDLEKVAREISIEKKYLVGLEEEDGNVFPGEAYLIGFLRNYSNYLELNTEFIMKLYKNKKIQESPVPEGLIPHKKSKGLLITLCVLFALLIAGAAVFFIIFTKSKKVVSDEEVIVSSKVKTRQFELNDSKFVQRVYKGDQLLIPTDKNGRIILTVKDTLSAFGLETPSGVYYVELSEESEIDINGDSNPDLIVYVSDISATDENRGAEISVLLRHGVSSYSNASSEVVVDDIPFASELNSKNARKVILEDNRAYPFTINASFRGSCLFRNKVDREDSIEAYFAKGEVFTATPRNSIRLWISNSNTVKFTIIADSKSFDLDIGAAGQVTVEDIKWIKDTDGKYKLVVIELD